MAETSLIQNGSSAPPNYGAYQNEVYGAGLLHGIKPTVTTDPNKLEQQAKGIMSAPSWAYVAGGAGERATMDSNRLAFRQWKLAPRMLRATTVRDLRTTLFHTTYPTPVLCSPIGVQGIFHPDAECGVAEVMGSIGVPFVCSTSSTQTMEDIAAANDRGAGGPGKGQRWFQLYWPQSNDVTESLLHRASAANFTTLVITLDTWSLAWRPWDLDHTNMPFAQGIGNAIGFSDPVFRSHFSTLSGGKTPEQDSAGASRAWIADVFSGAAHSWEDLAHVRACWHGPILLKGIQSMEDAVLAADHGMDGVIVSNHGGRQLDGAIGSLEVLPEIAEAVRGRKIPDRRAREDRANVAVDGDAGPCGQDFRVLFDSGIRTGVDVIKALCLGAHAVLIGRPWVYGLGIAGKNGARDAMRGILADLDQSMGLAGIQSIQHCKREMIRRVQYGGDLKSSS